MTKKNMHGEEYDWGEPEELLPPPEPMIRSATQIAIEKKSKKAHIVEVLRSAASKVESGEWEPTFAHASVEKSVFRDELTKHEIHMRFVVAPSQGGENES